ncbi:hypothetical protein MSAN_00323400 [Mycena sanguinolenta]|uniref:Transmembrane protein n=1 Tax=Mycena sanguinolenta TaxID=230812 RepID=A0A8H7DGC0_9AGAR|nr:hypothetical protein MSAN_00323400 [Mycena sanguinolenta]
MNVVIVDDKDSSIAYSGTWETGGTAVEYHGTTTWSPLQGSIATFAFNGSQVTVFGSIRATFAPTASMNFVVDGGPSGTYIAGSVTNTIHHIPLWVSPSLNEGPHTLVITQGEAMAAPTLGPIFLDYIIYNTTSSTAGPYFIDDSDARVTYTPASSWQNIQSDPDFGHTSHASTSPGNSFVLQFEGSSISMYGDIKNGSNASMVIDGGTPVFFAPPIQTTNVTANSLLFKSGALSDGTHSLAVAAENGSPVSVDYFLVTPNSNASSNSSPSSSASGSPPGTSSSPATSPSSSVATKPRKTVSTSVIAPAVLGAVLLVVLIASLLLWRRRRRPYPRDGEASTIRPAVSSPVTPFLSTTSESAEELPPPMRLVGGYTTRVQNAGQQTHRSPSFEQPPMRLAGKYGPGPQNAGQQTHRSPSLEEPPMRLAGKYGPGLQNADQQTHRNSALEEPPQYFE